MNRSGLRGLLECRLALLPPEREGEDPALTAERESLQARIAALTPPSEPWAERLPYGE